MAPKQAEAPVTLGLGELSYLLLALAAGLFNLGRYGELQTGPGRLIATCSLVIGALASSLRTFGAANDPQHRPGAAC